jgi:hypothetical protein
MSFNIKTNQIHKKIKKGKLNLYKNVLEKFTFKRLNIFLLN